MIYVNTISPKSKILKKLLLHKTLHYSYTKTKYNDKEEITNNTFITYIETLLNGTNNPALIQERKLNLDTEAYENKIYTNVYKPLARREIDFHDNNSYWKTSIKDKINWFPFPTIR